MTSPARSLCKIFGPGMTWGMYNSARGLFAYATAALSADIPSVDARPYHLVLGKGFKLARSVISMKNKRKAEGGDVKYQNKSVHRIIIKFRVLVLQQRCRSGKAEPVKMTRLCLNSMKYLMIVFSHRLRKGLLE